MPDLMTPAATPEIRRAVIADVQWRDAVSTGEPSRVVEGHAAVTGQITTLYEGRYYVWREQIAPGAFDQVLARIALGQAAYPVVLNREHNNATAVASTARRATELGGLDLTVDGVGLKVFARLDPSDPDVMALERKMALGILRQMSFAFTVERDSVLVETDAQEREVETRTILEVRDLFDVTIVAHGAYSTTDAQIRSIASARDHARTREAVTAGEIVAAPGPVDSTHPVAAPPVGVVPSHRLAAARVRAQLARQAHPMR